MKTCASSLAACAALPCLLVALSVPFGHAFGPPLQLHLGKHGMCSGGLLQYPTAISVSGRLPSLGCLTLRCPATCTPLLLLERKLSCPALATRRTLPRRSVALSAEADDQTSGQIIGDALVSFKGDPCLVQGVSDTEDKAEILQLNGRSRKAKFKDLQVVFPGPVRSWELQEIKGDLPEPVESPEKLHAQLLDAGGTVTVCELAEKLFKEEPTHLTAWVAWNLVKEDLYFTGTAQAISPQPKEKVAKELEKVRLKAEKEKDEASFLKRVKSKKIKPADMDRMQDLEDLALYRSETSPTLKVLGIQQTPQEAHKLLLELGVWDTMTNPWPARFGINMAPFPEALEQEAVAELKRAKQLPREDFTALPAFAIDDADIADPDDAVSVEREGDNLRVWIHVADVGSVVKPSSALDLAARARGASCYLPNGTLTMFPPILQDNLGLGLDSTSPALSIGLLIEEDGHIDDVKIVRSTVKVTRKSYAEAQELLEQGDQPWADMEEASNRFRDRRLENGAVGFQMPQPDVKVDAEGTIQIKVAPHFDSNEMVMEMMLMAGEAVSQFALDNNLPFIYSTQGPLKPVPGKSSPKKQLQKGGRPPAANPFEIAKAQKEANKEERKVRVGPPQTLAEKFEFRKRFAPSTFQTTPELHTGLGMAMYSQISSPLRRYGDLVLHQQLNAFLDGEQLLEEEDLLDRIAETEGRMGSSKKAERFSSQFYTLNWLHNHPNWKGPGTCCALWQPRPGVPKVATVLLEDLAFFTNVRCKVDVKPDGDMLVALRGVRIVDMKADMMHDVKSNPKLYGTAETEMHKQGFRARKNVGTRMF